MKSLSILPIFLIFLFLVFSFVSCTCTDSDDDDSGDDDFSGDDDSTDDDTGDDDSTPDDDDDNDDNDDGDDIFSPDKGEWFGDLYLQHLETGSPGEDGTSLTSGPDGTLYAAVAKRHVLYVYSLSPGKAQWTREKVTYFGVDADIEAASDGTLVVAFTSDWVWYDTKLAVATNGSGSWVVSIIDDGTQTGYSPSLALDDGDYTHIAYYDEGEGVLKYATNRTGGWTTEIAAEGAFRKVGLWPSLAVDEGDGFAHVAFADDEYFDRNFYYATNRSGAWEASFIYSGSTDSSILVDDSGTVHIFHSHLRWLSSLYELLYSNNQTGSWITKKIDSNGDTGTLPSAAIDRDGNLNVAYCRDCYELVGDEQVRFATNSSGSWATELAVSNRGDGYFPSLAIDSVGNAHVVSHNAIEEDLLYFDKSGGQWSTTILENGRYLSDMLISLDPAGIPFIVAQTLEPSRRLLLGRRIDGVWKWEVAAKQEEAGYPFDSNQSFGIDSQGFVHLAFYDGVSESLLYAIDQSGTWEIFEIASPILEKETALVVDETDTVHIVFSDVSGISYSTNQNGQWEIETVHTEAGWSGKSLAIDPFGHAHVSFSSDGFLYATNKGGYWVVSIVDADEYSGYHSDIDLDSAGNVHMCFSNTEWDEVRYSTNLSGSWETMVVQAQSLGCDIAVDSDDIVHILSGGNYLTLVDGTWESTTVLVNLAGSMSMALDEIGNVHAVLDSFYAMFPQNYAKSGR